MMTMLKVVAVFALALVATEALREDALTIGLEFDEKYVEIADMTAKGSVPVPATVVNPNVEVVFSELGQVDYMKVFVPKSIPEVGADKQDEVCGNFQGIKLPETNEVFCNASIIILGLGYYNRDFLAPNVKLIFRSDLTEAFALEVPIFRIPAEAASANDFNLQAWGRDKRVGVSLPVNMEEIEAIKEKRPITFDLNWLTDVFSYQITENKYKVENKNKLIQSFVTRPIVMSSEMVDKLVDILTTEEEEGYEEEEEDDDEEEEEDEDDDTSD